MLLIDGIVADAAVQPALEALFLVYPALCVHLWHYVCRSLRTLDDKQLRTLGLSTCRICLHVLSSFFYSYVYVYECLCMYVFVCLCLDCRASFSHAVLSPIL